MYPDFHQLAGNGNAKTKGEHSAFVFTIAKINPQADLSQSYKFKYLLFPSQKYTKITIRISVDNFLIWKIH